MKKQKIASNFLDKIPTRNPDIGYTVDEKGVITLEIENKGLFNRIAQKVFKKPKISYIHLDEMGSFVWPIINGEKSISEIGEAVYENFGEKAHPLYERLAKYFQILESYGFVKLS
ncbi:MAG: PqqD family protein [Clostridia bacterium]|nr:PqqD family protein [Clostridia bacterium]MBQ2387879.1 PqqD family protein [Clostridia bacterium]